MYRIARITAVAALATAAGLLTVLPAAADDAHQACVRALVCTGNLLDVHDIITGLATPVPVIPVVPVAAP